MAEAGSRKPSRFRAFPDTWARTTPNKIAVLAANGNDSLTYRELDERSARLAHALRKAGLKRGDGIAFMLENRIEFFVCAWAAQRSGLFFTPLNTRLGLEEISSIVEDCRPCAVMISTRFRAIADAISRRVPDLAMAVSVGGDLPGYDSLDSLLDDASRISPEDESEGAPLMYSSGTTGRPKAVARSLPDRIVGESDAWTNRISDLYRFDRNTVYYCPTPLYHGAGLWWTMVQHRFGGSVILTEKFDPSECLEIIRRHRVTHTQLVPTMFVRLLSLPEHERKRKVPASLQVAIHAAAPCPIDVKEKMIDWWGPILVEYYASTEANGQTYIDSHDWLRHKGSVGRAIMGTPHIVDEAGNECPPGTPGLVYFENPMPPFEYRGDPEKTLESRHPMGWTTVGDMGYLDQEGYLYLTDRKTDMIVSGGVNIYPREVEERLSMHPSVRDVAVFGVPNAEFGEEVKAIVQPENDDDVCDALARELMDYCRAHLAHYKCPRSIEFRNDFPREPNGKLMKRLLRDEYWTERKTRII